MAVDTAGSAEFFDTGSAPCKNEMQRMQLFVRGFYLTSGIPVHKSTRPSEGEG